MVSVLTLTYKRHHLLEEAIESFLRQGVDGGAEMVIINDNSEVDYVFEHPNVKIINHKERFGSIAEKLKFGYQQCTYDWIYRLDDDDLLAPEGLLSVLNAVMYNSPGFDIIRSEAHYYFSENKFHGIAGSVNNGNTYRREYLDSITWPGSSIGEDSEITFGRGAKILTINPITMIYRWGMNTLHVSGIGQASNREVLDKADEMLDNREGIILLNPHFNEDYYGKIKHTPRENYS